MKRAINIVYVSFLTFLCITSWSQNFPVRVNPLLTPPYTPFITDYTEAGSDKLTLQVLLTDLTVNDYRCKLRLTIEGVNISITTNPNYLPPPLLLQGGAPEILYGSDLADYFNLDNLVFKGISRNEIQRNGNKLPEGIYRFTFEVLDYNRNVVVSNKGTATAWMLLNAPPIINLPLNDTKLKPVDPQNIVFQWTPRHRGSPNSAFTTEYEVKLYEIWPKGRNAFDAVATSRPVYEVTTETTMAVYGLAETPLVLGREYALQVKAKDTAGKDLFNNNGLSEVIRFIYGDECPMPIDLQADNISNNKARIKWQSNSLNTGYVVRYREKREGAEWFEENTTQSYFSTMGLQPATTYEYQLAGQCLSYYSDYSEQKTLTTLITNPNAFICGDPRAIPIPDGSPPLPVLMTNDSIKAGGFDIIVNKATGTAGKFSGEGIAIIPWFNYAKVRITFENITVNKSYQLTGGFINSVWDKDSKLLRTFEQLNNKDTVSTKFKSDVATFEADSTVMITGMILSVTADASGNISVSTTDGGAIVLEKGKSYAIADEVGNGYLVDKEGNIKKTTATDAINAGNKGEREYSSDPNRSVLFTKSDQTKYGLDTHREGTLAQNYQQTENGKYISWKALATGQNDFIQVLGEGNTDLSKIKFKLEGLTGQQLTANGQQLTLTGSANGTNEEVLAIDNSSDTTKNGQILGKINLISYTQEIKNLVMVAVNGTIVPVTTDEVRTALNSIYGQAVVSWSVNGIIQHLDVSGFDETKLDDGGSGLLSNYTADMKKVLNAYLNGNSLADDTYYLFFVTNALSTSKLGYMPRSKQAGFIFTKAHLGNTELIHTIAHELGHGAFHLKHTFSEFPSITEGTSNNLMDYSSGTALDKYQWDNIRNPEGVLGLFEDDEEGALNLTPEQLTVWWNNLPVWKKATELLREHLDDTGVFEKVTSNCTANKCIINAELKLGEDLTYTTEITITSDMSQEFLVDMLIFKYKLEQWEAFDITAENIWDELYNWWRLQNENLAKHRGGIISVPNFFADVFTAPTLYPAVSGWITGKHWRDGHDLAGWEQGLAALDFLVAEELVKGCVTNFIAKIGGRTISLLKLNRGTKDLLQRSIEKGLKFSVIADNEITILSKDGQIVGNIVNDILIIPYSKFGRDIVCLSDRTTTILGKFVDLVDGDGIKIIKENKLYKYGENPGGINILDDANWSWDINENWLREAVKRGDVIRLVSDPRDIRNLYVFKEGQFRDAFNNIIQESELLTKGALSPFGKEVKLLNDILGKKFNPTLFVYE